MFEKNKNRKKKKNNHHCIRYEMICVCPLQIFRGPIIARESQKKKKGQIHTCSNLEIRNSRRTREMFSPDTGACTGVA